MVKITHETTTNEITLADIQRRKAEIKAEISKEKDHIVAITNNLVTPFKSSGEGTGFFKNVKTGMFIVEGLVTGINVANRVIKLFKK
jgi:hypothetical protein